MTGIGNPEDTAQAIIAILQNPELHHSMSLAARARVKAYYDYDEMIHTYRSIYQSAMESEGVWQA